jgi:hypothetical protein
VKGSEDPERLCSSGGFIAEVVLRRPPTVVGGCTVDFCVPKVSRRPWQHRDDRRLDRDESSPRAVILARDRLAIDDAERGVRMGIDPYRRSGGTERETSRMDGTGERRAIPKVDRAQSATQHIELRQGARVICKSREG